MASRLEELLVRYPDADHYIVAHSHGGNVALKAVNGRSLGDRINCIVCLCTPFIDASLAPIARGAMASALTGIGLFAFFAWAFASPSIGATWSGFVLLALLIGLGLTDLSERETKARNAVESLATPQVEGIRVRVLTAPRDEALQSLRIAAFVQRLLKPWEWAAKHIGEFSGDGAGRRLLGFWLVWSGGFLLTWACYLVVEWGQSPGGSATLAIPFSILLWLSLLGNAFIAMACMANAVLLPLFATVSA